ncbi:MAG: ABC transporter ATP-binding protein [Oscillospiraceae bacterium]|nr:ABC transporter ATP-binding protein [Oscillospiraceae bacterium]
MIKKLAPCVGKYKKDALLTPLFVILEVAMEVLIPLVMVRLIDDGVEVGNMDAVLRYGAVLVAAALLSLGFGVLSGYFASSASAGFAKNLRQKMYYKIQEFSFRNIDRFSTSSLVTRLTTDVNNVQQAFQMITRIAVRSPVMLIFSLLMSYRINPRLSVIYLAVVPVLAIGLFFIIRKSFPIMQRVFKTYDRLNNVVQENVRGIRVVKSFVREEYEEEKFNGVSGELFKNYSAAEKLIVLNNPLMQFCAYSCMLLLSWFGAKFIVSATMTTGELMSLLSYTMRILMALMILSMVFVMITIARESALRIIEVLDEQPEFTDPADPVKTVADGGIEFDHVSFSYANNENLALKDVSVKIKPGETIGILGGTGSAKSTFVQLIPRLYEATSGSVRVGGRDVRDYDMQTLRDGVAMVLQKNELFSGTISENLRWGDADATDAEIVHACELAQADGFIREFPEGYETRIEQGGSNVSGGQKQRLCIARALLKKPKILILDDSTSAVDTATDARIRKAFREEIPGTTKLIIAQRVASVLDADRILVLDNGRVNGFGTHEELLASNDIYREVYESQTKGGEQDGE